MPARVAWSPELPLKLPRKRAPFPIRRNDAEFRLQVAVIDMLGKLVRPGWWWTAFPAGEYRTEATGRRLKRMGLKAGVPDLLLIGPSGQHYWVELKARHGRLAEAQGDFQELCAERGISYAICYGFAEAEAQLRAWCVLRPEARAIR